MNCGACSSTCTTICTETSTALLSARALVKTASSRACSSAVSGRRQARLPKSAMNFCTHADSPLAGSQPKSPDRLAVAALLNDSEAATYCSASAGLTLSALALLVKPSCATSAVKFAAGALWSPSKSATVLSYSMWVRRRTGAKAGGASCGTTAPPPTPAVPAPPTLPEPPTDWSLGVGWPALAWQPSAHSVKQHTSVVAKPELVILINCKLQTLEPTAANSRPRSSPLTSDTTPHGAATDLLVKPASLLSLLECHECHRSSLYRFKNPPLFHAHALFRPALHAPKCAGTRAGRRNSSGPLVSVSSNAPLRPRRLACEARAKSEQTKCLVSQR